MIFAFLFALFASTAVASPRWNVNSIVLYGDVHKDVEFFTRTFPWIIDNIGGGLNVGYNLLGSGRYSVPQACALETLMGNTFLQAEYLRCEARGYPSEYCLCEAGIDPQNFKRCVASGGFRASSASARYSALGIDFSPIIDLGSNNTVFGVDDISLLKIICTIYGDNPPRGCTHYSNQTGSFLEKKALAQFDRACLKEFPIDDDKPEVDTTTEWTKPTTTPPWWTTMTTTPWGCNTQPGDSTTTSPPWSTTSPPWSTTSPPWWTTTTPPWWTTMTTTPWGCNTQPGDSTTTSPPLPNTSTPWPTTSTPWHTTSTPLPNTSTPWHTTSPFWSTTPPPWWTTTSRPWWSTTSKPWPTTSPPWSTTPTPWWSTTSPPWWTTTSPPWWSTTPWWSTPPTPQLPTRPSPPTWPPWPTPSNPWALNEEVTEAPNSAPE